MEPVRAWLVRSFASTRAKLVGLFIWVRQRPAVRYGLNFSLMVAFLALVARRLSADWYQLVASGLAFDLRYFGLTIALYGANFILFSWVWHAIIAHSGGPKDWRLNSFLYAYTYLAKFLPTPVWFVGGRIAAYRRVGLRGRTTAGLTVLELALHSAAGLFLLSALVVDVTVPITWLALLVTLAVIIAFESRRLWGLKAKVTKSLGLECANIRKLDGVSWLLVDMISWVVAGLFAVCLVKSLSLPIRPSYVGIWLVWILANLVAYVSTFTLGGAGFLRELSLAWLLAREYSWEAAVTIAAASRVVMTIAGLLWSGIALGVIRLLSGEAPLRDKMRSTE